MIDGVLYHGFFRDRDTDPQDTFGTRPYGRARRLGIEICTRVTITGVMKLFAESDLPDLLKPGKWDFSGKLPSSERQAVLDAFDGDTRGKKVGPEHVLDVMFDNCGKTTFAGQVLRRKP